MKLSNSFNSILKIYNKTSNIGKLLIFICLLLIIVIFFKYVNQEALLKREGFRKEEIYAGDKEKFVFVKDLKVFDEFYAGIYDYLVYNNMKNDYEITAIINRTRPNVESRILDIGSGTGHHVAKLAEKGYKVMGIDQSPAMILKARLNYPDLDFKIGDVVNQNIIEGQSFTHILCLYFTIYYIADKRLFFENCMHWLNYGGFLIIHLVDREKFDPILPTGNPLFIVSPQKYAPKRITHTKIKFNEFAYTSDFKFDQPNNKAVFEEKFQFDNGKTRKQEQTLYMEDANVIIQTAQDVGFILQGKIDLMNCGYEYQYLYIFTKSN